MNCLLLIEVIAVTMTLLQSAVAGDRIAGRWGSEQRSIGGLGISFDFSEGGKCNKTTGVMVDGRWTRRGDTLTRVLPTGQGKFETQSIVVSIQGNSMTQLIDGQRRVLKRVRDAASSADSIDGLWTYRHEAGGIAYEDYGPDGRFLFRLPAATESCSWEVARNRLRLSVNGITTEFTFSIAGDVLALDHEGERQVFRRENILPPPLKQ